MEHFSNELFKWLQGDAETLPAAQKAKQLQLDAPLAPPTKLSPSVSAPAPKQAPPLKRTFKVEERKERLQTIL